MANGQIDALKAERAMHAKNGDHSAAAAIDEVLARFGEVETATAAPAERAVKAPAKKASRPRKAAKKK